MRKMLLVALLTVVTLGACSPQENVSIYQGCACAWVRITDGRLRAKIERLDWGGRARVGLTGDSNSSNQMVLSADFFRVGDNKPLGTESRTFFPMSGSGVGVQETNWDLSCPQQVQNTCSR